MAKPTARIGAIQFGFVVGILAILTRAAQLQIVEAERWERDHADELTERERKFLQESRKYRDLLLLPRFRATAQALAAQATRQSALGQDELATALALQAYDFAIADSLPMNLPGAAVNDSWAQTSPSCIRTPSSSTGP